MKDKFKRLYSTIHADEGLVQHTLQAAKQQESRRRRSHLMLIPAVAALLCIVMVSAFLRSGTPEDTVASPGGTEVPGDDFSLIRSQTTDVASCDMNGMTFSLLSTHALGEETCILFSLQGGAASEDMELLIELTGSGDTAQEQRVVPAFYDGSADTAVFLASYHHSAAQPGELVTLAIKSCISKYEGAAAWPSDWNSLYAQWSQAVNTTTGEIAYRLTPNGSPLYTMTDGFAIMAAGFAPDGLHIMTRYQLDPDDVRAAEGNYTFGRQASLLLVPIQALDAPTLRAESSVPPSYTFPAINTSSMTYWLEYCFPIQAYQADKYGLYASADYQFADETGAWSLTFPLFGTRLDSIQEDAQKGSDIHLEAGTITTDAPGQITIPVYIRGSGIDQLSIPDLSFSSHLAIEQLGWNGFSRPAPHDGTEPHITVKLTLREGCQPEDLGESFTITMSSVSIGNKFVQTLHDDLVLQNLPFTELVERTFTSGDYIWTRDVLPPCEPIIDFGGGMAFTAIGFDEEGNLVIQTRTEQALPPNSECFINLVAPGDPDTDEDDLDVWPSLSTGWEDENNIYYYRQDVYPVSREELSEYALCSHICRIGELIEGEWVLTIPVSDIPSGK